MASSGPSFCPQALRNFRYYYSVTHWGKKVLFTIYNFSFLHGQHKTIREILTGNGVQLNKFPFNSQDVNNLTDKPPEDLDITLMHKICRALWEKGLNDPGGELKELVKKIKGERNVVSHEVAKMTDAELAGKLAAFQATLEETLRETKSVFSSYAAEIDHLEKEIQSAVPKLVRKIREKYDPSVPEDLQDFQKEIDEFGKELSEYIQQLSREELLSLYVRLCQISAFDWLAQFSITDPCNIMVCVKMEESQVFHWGRGAGGATTVDQNGILKVKDPSGNDPKVVIISGDAGSGKTTMLCSIAEKWHKNAGDMPELSSFQILLYMEFRNRSHDNFDDYLRNLLPRTVSLFQLKHIKSSVIESKCLVLCDGYDERNEKSAKLFQDILSLNSKNMKIVVTTRPGNTKRLTEIVNKEKHARINLQVLGLQKEDMKLLTETLIGHLVEDEDTRRKLEIDLLRKIDEMDSKIMVILQTPLFFNLFVLLYVECQDLSHELSSRASLYLQLKEHMTKRISNKTGISTESLEEFDALYRKWSLKHYIEKKYEWTEEDVKRFKSELRCPEVLDNFDAIMSSYFSIKPTTKLLEIGKVFCHRHRSEQEFAAAGTICDDIVASSRRQQGGNIFLEVLLSKGILKPEDLSPRTPDPFDDLGEILGTVEKRVIPEVRGMLAFVPGILHSTEKSVLYRIIEDIHDFYVKFNEVYELHATDDLLVPCAETRLDDKVLESLVSRFRKIYAYGTVYLNKMNDLFVLPSLLSKLRPSAITFLDVPRDLAELNKTLQVTNQLGIRSEFLVTMSRKRLQVIAGQVLHPVDYLGMDFSSDALDDPASLRPISLQSSAKELVMKYFLYSDDVDRVAQVVNRTVPPNRPEGTTRLTVFLPLSHNIGPLLQLLTVGPLRSITVVSETNFDMSEWEDLKRLCKEKGLGQLQIH
ncbi:uncharacterized protein [Macrobrachium rosenbergii]|uniref:uncharacterized protein n=1 Tax=Macrobrachium rosenbergii TaxID=79674 RepID=UPI0034D43C75